MPTARLHWITRELKRRFPHRFPEINAHDPRNTEGVDFVWISSNTPDASIEGEVLTIGRYPNSRDTWIATLQIANHYGLGDWEIKWTAQGTKTAIFQSICSLPQLNHQIASSE